MIWTIIYINEIFQGPKIFYVNTWSVQSVYSCNIEMADLTDFWRYVVSSITGLWILRAQFG